MSKLLLIAFVFLIVSLKQASGFARNFFNRPKLMLLSLADSYTTQSAERLGAFQRFQVLNMELGNGISNDSKRYSVLMQCIQAGWESTEELLSFAKDFEMQPEALSRILINDFGFSTLNAHFIRAAVLSLLRSNRVQGPKQPVTMNGAASEIDRSNDSKNKNVTFSKNRFKDVIVSSNAKSRKGFSSKSSYGIVDLSKERKELAAFFLFMTEPPANSQESSVRKSTAKVYLKHAELFFSWYKMHFMGQFYQENQIEGDGTNNATFLKLVFPDQAKENILPVFEFLKWLRMERKIAVSYEANMLRGLTKLAKFRFAAESKADPAYGEKSFEDISLVKELRKLHSEANRKQCKAPRVSNEQLKWISWPEYLNVVRSLKNRLEGLLQEYAQQQVHDQESVHIQEEKEVAEIIGSEEMQVFHTGTAGEQALTPSLVARKGKRIAGVKGIKNTGVKVLRKKIATEYQRYLLLAFFSCVPDRQRTFRELELGKSFVKDDQGHWTIRHGPDDYKTGDIYGERPPLVISPELSPAVDAFIAQWREALSPRGPHLFVQPRTGGPLTGDSVYAMVTSTCYALTGKRTNPHLLRDIIVTHVRNSAASERELEALALYMGHSLSMQRSSYDRRSLNQKVAPAVSLLEALSAAPSAPSASTSFS
jgi:hypothetical protein